MAEQNVNYTDEMVARLHDVYDGEAPVAERDAQVQELADELGKSPASIRAKLTREGIYVPKGNVTKAGAPVIKKADIVNHIADRLGVNAEVVESLEKATKVALQKVADALDEVA